ncbi:probable cyclin-dependent serine/threonine-protein kinase DDB_G0292550 isoform X2 [Anastrepha obliqua]|uniref:probable cyclin-dependent serine/threonine-protein kinase DDB_G0292550 isoform X1 n=1 Tax=Anastrepha obliqua TaxID=95512 RepID=UPI00240A4887|nr:probable cyclin-dependent serine/threonine-protein kinase DDB_G0292550 isoform X1 [Anastrepha obliqua]XP_054733586.1 probable cyclin-dependent serine/threonine-protein kinase DDB_G0292550 isoform X2 [Anastrepha obliqua]
MPVGHQFASRPYSSFRATRGSCNTHYCQGSNNSSSNSNSSCNQNSNSNVGALNGHNGSTSSYSSQTNNFNNNNHNNNNKTNDNHLHLNCNNNNNQGNNFGRQQAYRSSFYGTRYQSSSNTNANNTPHQVNGDANGNTNTNNNASDKRFTSIVATTTIKPLTPKLVRRIETTCSSGNCGGGVVSNGVTHTKQRAPLPPVSNSNSTVNTPPAANKQYLRTRNQPPPPPPVRNASNFERFHNSNLSFRQKNSVNCAGAGATAVKAPDCHESPKYTGATFYNSSTRASGGVGSQKRTYCTAQKVHKENVPVRSVKNYPAPLPPNTPKPVTKKKYRENLKLASVSASPNLNNRRFGGASVGGEPNKGLSASQRRKNYVPFNGQANCATAAASKNGSTGSNESTGSSGSNGSPKTKKIFSTKFPQGLPFEDEFYRQRFCRSYSQSSSSNYSFYSSVGAPATPRSNDFDDIEHGNEAHERSAIDEDDEFQRKPASDEPLYVDFSKVMQRQNDCNNDYANRDYSAGGNTHYCSSSSSGATTTTIVPTTTWIGTTRTTHSPLPSVLAAKLAGESSRLDAYVAAAASAATVSSSAGQHGSPHLRRTTKSKISHSINDYLYTSCGAATTTTAMATSATKKTNGNVFLTDDPEDGYYTHTSVEPPPQTDIYLAVASWAPKCSHPTKVHIPASSSIADRNNNATAAYAMMNSYDHRQYYSKTATLTAGDILEPTTNECK